MVPTKIKANKKLFLLELYFDDGSEFHLPMEYVRVYTPSIEARGYSGPRQFPKNKETVNIAKIEPVGNYAVKIIFSDGHKSGLYTWEYLHELGVNFERYWQEYIQK